MNRKLETAILPTILLLLLAVLVCPQTVVAQTGIGVQTNSGFHPDLPLSAANTSETNNTATSTAQQPAENVTQQNQMPLMIVIIVAAFAAYIAVIAVLASKKIR